MKNRNIVIAVSAFLITACASNAKNPIGNEIITNYNASAISVTLMDGKKIPDRYDNAARDYLNEGANETEKTEFEAFIEGLEPSAESDEDYTGEAFLAWLIQRQLDGKTGAMLRGETDATLDVELKSTTWPNTATMMLVGEMIGTKFEFSLTDENDEVVVESVGAISPFVQRSAGAGGGCLEWHLEAAAHNTLRTWNVLQMPPQLLSWTS